MTRKGSIFLPSTSVLDSDKWRPPFSKLSNRSTLLLSYMASDVVPLINEELESSSSGREAISQRNVASEESRNLRPVVNYTNGRMIRMNFFVA